MRIASHPAQNAVMEATTVVEMQCENHQSSFHPTHKGLDVRVGAVEVHVRQQHVKPPRRLPRDIGEINHDSQGQSTQVARLLR